MKETLLLFSGFVYPVSWKMKEHRICYTVSTARRSFSSSIFQTSPLRKNPLSFNDGYKCEYCVQNPGGDECRSTAAGIEFKTR